MNAHQTSINARVFILVLAVVGALLNVGSAVAAPSLIEIDTFLPVMVQGRPYRLEIMVVKPAGATGRLPVALITHGAGTDEQNRATHAHDFVGIARDFAHRGWLAVFVVRRGYGRSDGQLPPIPHSCEAPNFAQYVEPGVDDLAAALAAIGRWSDADMRRVLLVGGSTGGATVLALAARQPAGLVGVVNISGGLQLANSNGGLCPFQQSLITAMAYFGSRVRVPSLWLYSENDSFFGSLARPMHGAFVRAGAVADLVMIPPLAHDGHTLCCSPEGRKLWLPPLDRFLMAHALPTWNRPALEAAIRHAGFNPPQGQIKAYLDVLAGYFDAPSEKALAASPSGRTMSWAVSSDLAKARQESLDECRSQTTEGCEILLEDFTVVGRIITSVD